MRLAGHAASLAQARAREHPLQLGRYEVLPFPREAFLVCLEFRNSLSDFVTHRVVQTYRWHPVRLDDGRRPRRFDTNAFRKCQRFLDQRRPAYWAKLAPQELKRPPVISSGLPGSKLLNLKWPRPPRFSQTCIGEQRLRIKIAVPSKKQKSCCGEDTRPRRRSFNARRDRSEFWRQSQPFPPP